MANNPTEQKIIDELIALPESHLIAVLREVFEKKIPYPEEKEYHKSRYFLGTASCLMGDDNSYGKWEIEAIGYIDKTEYGNGSYGPDIDFSQFGTCRNCGVKIASNVKNAICPICSGKVYCT